MDVSLVSQKSIRIKSKTSAVILDPDAAMPKTQADAVLLSKKDSSLELGKVEEYRLVVKGPGEYEISGIGISCFGIDSDLVHLLDVDGVLVLLSAASALSKVKDKIKNCNVLVLCVDEVVHPSLVKDVSSHVVLLYGEKKLDLSKELGAEDKGSIKKYQASSEKLPQEMEVLVLA